MSMSIEVKSPGFCYRSPSPGSVCAGGNPMSPEELFGKRVRAARKAAKLTLEAAAEKVDIHANHLAQIERGTKRPSFELIFALADAVGVSAMSLFMFERDETDEKVLR